MQDRNQEIHCGFRGEVPNSHPWRLALNDEVHARPYQTLQAPQRASYLAMLAEPAEREGEYAHVAELCLRYGCEPPPPEARYFVADCGAFRLRWERHGEFSSYTVFEAGAGGEPFAQPAANALPPQWLAALPGSLIVAAHVALLPGAEGQPDIESISAHFSGNTLAGAQVADGGAVHRLPISAFIRTAFRAFCCSIAAWAGAAPVACCSACSKSKPIACSLCSLFRSRAKSARNSPPPSANWPASPSRW